MPDPHTLKNLAQSLQSRARDLKNLHVVTGFDAFVDEFISVVGTRKNLQQFDPVPDITTFGKLITAAAGHSSLREIVVHSQEPGGCAVNLADGLAALGLNVHCFATMGNPRHAAFEHVASRFAQAVSWASQPGRTLAFEFSDGKLMFSAVSQLAEFTPDLLQSVLRDGAYAKACAAAPLIALTDWTLYPHMTACWKTLIDLVYSKLTHRPFFYFDLVDPSSRSRADVAAMLNQLSAFEAHGPTILGLNANEANLVSQTLDQTVSMDTSDLPNSLAHQADAIRRTLNIAQVVIHHQKCAALAEADHTASADGPYTPKPLKSTGAGDRFNAGYTTALLLNLPPDQRLLLANAASGYFVRNAHSASPEQLTTFLNQWADNQLP